MVNFERENILDQLESLKNLPQVKEVKALRQRLERELERLSSKEVIKKTTIRIDKNLVNVKRSSKGKRYWRFIKLVKDRIPNLSTKEIRSQFKKRREQGQSDIPDAIWQNVSG